MTVTEKRPEPVLHEIEPATLKAWVESGEAIVVDVREPDEHAAERIDGAELNPLSRFDAAAMPADGAVKVVLHCRSGERSAQAARHLIDAGRGEAYHLKGGIIAWKDAGLPVQRVARAPVSIMRQVQICAGSLVLVGVLLGVLVSPWFLILSGFIGAGLVFAGASGTCGMAVMLARMPWNRVLRSPG